MATDNVSVSVSVSVKVQGNVYNGLSHTPIYLNIERIYNDNAISLPSKIKQIKDELEKMRGQLNPKEGNGLYRRRKIKKAVVNTEIQMIHIILETLYREYN